MFKTQIKVSLLSILILLSSILVGVSPVAAASCPPTNVDGKTVANVILGDLKVAVKRVDYPKSGALDPPKSPKFAGLSIRHQPLGAIQGSSVIVWHASYHGCKGSLNALTESPLNTKFLVVDEKGASTEYKLVEKLKIPKGQYEADWFRLNGSRQLVFITCTGKVVNGSYTQNQILIAIPS